MISPLMKQQDTFDNPIIMLNSKIVKKQAQNLIEKLVELLPQEQIDELIDEIEEREQLILDFI